MPYSYPQSLLNVVSPSYLLLWIEKTKLDLFHFNIRRPVHATVVYVYVYTICNILFNSC